MLSSPIFCTQSLISVKQAFTNGETGTQKLIQLGRLVLEKHPEFKIQYYEIRHSQTLETLAQLSVVNKEGALIAVATYLGNTRLIDNLEL
ncbi:MAG: pantoate--beta-alanine ligase [Deltaproteobacteria bacterium]|nr:pantoate--beta-alanine ligase [Deltaproteobacteria bacterium]